MSSQEPWETPDWYESVFEAVRLVPRGTVATYGQVAGMVTAVSVTARQVGAALRIAPADVPWHRIVGAGGRLPIGKRSPELELLQRRLLGEEGAPFVTGSSERLDMSQAQYRSDPET